MFNKTPAQEASTPVSTAPSDLVIRTMPREFYGKEAALVDAKGHGNAVPVQPAPEVKPVPVVPVVPVVAPATLAVAPGPLPPRRHAKAGVMVTAMVALLMVGGVSYGAYVLIDNANKAAEKAQQEASAAAAALAAQKAAEAAAAEKAAAEAAKAAATPVPGKDTDTDGLTDVEELLYGTNFRDPDTDADTFLDGNEVFHGYHPLGLAPATLLDTGAVKVLSDATYPYHIYYPATWTVALARDTFGVTFQSARQAKITVTWEPKDATETLDDLLRGTVTDAERAQMKEMMTKEGYFGLTSADDRTAYLDMGTAMATLTYDLGGKVQIEYLQTFKMMANSFRFVPVTSTP